MSRSCEVCRGEMEEFARTRSHVWIGCRDCQRSWREVLDTTADVTDAPGPPLRASVSVRESMFGQYAMAAAAVTLAFLVRLALKAPIGNASPFLLFTPAVMVVAWYGGVGPAVAATVVGALLGNHFFLSAIGEPGIERWDRVVLFLLVGGLITSLTTVLKASRRRLAEGLWREQRARAEAEAANQTKDDVTQNTAMTGWRGSRAARYDAVPFGGRGSQLIGAHSPDRRQLSERPILSPSE
ncbi:MAG: DUF4118 domain-containing protein [Acidobacteriota bacterium]